MKNVILLAKNRFEGLDCTFEFSKAIQTNKISSPVTCDQFSVLLPLSKSLPIQDKQVRQITGVL